MKVTVKKALPRRIGETVPISPTFHLTSDHGLNQWWRIQVPAGMDMETLRAELRHQARELLRVQIRTVNTAAGEFAFCLYLRGS